MPLWVVGAMDEGGRECGHSIVGGHDGAGRCQANKIRTIIHSALIRVLGYN